MQISPYLEFRELAYFKAHLAGVSTEYWDWVQKQRLFITAKMYMLMVWERVRQLHVNNSMIIQTSWLMAHSITVWESLALIHGLVVSQNFSNLNYDLAVLSMILTYVIITYRHLLCLADSQVLTSPAIISALVRSDNTFLLALSVLVGNSNRQVLKLLPFTLYSILNLYTFVLEDLLKNSLISKTLLPYSGRLEQQILFAASTLELAAGIVYLGETTSYQGALTYYFITFLRLDCSDSLQHTFAYYTGVVHRCCEKYLSQETMETLEPWFSFVEKFLSTETESVTQEPPLSLKKPRRDRIASLNFDMLEIIDDLQT